MIRVGLVAKPTRINCQWAIPPDHQNVAQVSISVFRTVQVGLGCKDRRLSDGGGHKNVFANRVGSFR